LVAQKHVKAAAKNCPFQWSLAYFFRLVPSLGVGVCPTNAFTCCRLWHYICGRTVASYDDIVVLKLRICGYFWGPGCFMLYLLNCRVWSRMWNSDISRQDSHISGTGGRIATLISPADAELKIGLLRKVPFSNWRIRD
jgi:hypothetical protein